MWMVKRSMRELILVYLRRSEPSRGRPAVLLSVRTWPTANPACRLYPEHLQRVLAFVVEQSTFRDEDSALTRTGTRTVSPGHC